MQENDYGTPLNLVIKEKNKPLDISGATKLEIIFDRPLSNGKTTHDIDFTSDGTDGKLIYYVEDGLLDTPGKWKVQVVLTFPNGRWSTDIGVFSVEESL